MVFVCKAAKSKIPKEVEAAEDVLAEHMPAYQDAFKKYTKGLARLAASAPISKDGKAAADHFTRSSGAVRLINILREDLEDAYAESMRAGAQHGLEMAGIADRMHVQKARKAKPQDARTLGEKDSIALPISTRSKKWITDQSSKLIVQITDDVRNNARTIVSNSYKQNLHPDAIKTKLGQAVGLNDRLAGAVSKRYDATFVAATKAGQSVEDARARATEVADKYSDELIDYRGEMIARTEGKEAQSIAQEDSWDAAEEAGMMPDDTQKEWITLFDERTSEECKAMNGQVVPLDEDFDSEDIGNVERPPLHPNCRCTIGLVFA